MIKPSTEYKLTIDNKCIGEGSLRKMKKLLTKVKKDKSGAVWPGAKFNIFLSPASKIGDYIK